MPVALTTPVEDLPGVTARRARLLATLGLTNLGKLVAHLPSRHEAIEAESTIDQLTPGRIVTARGEITATRPVRHGRRPRFEAVLMDHTGRLDLVWFNGLYMADRIHPGMRVRVQGTARTRGPGLQVANPNLEVLSSHDDASPSDARPLRPVYPASEAISSIEIWRILTKVLPLALPLIEDHLPEDFRRSRNLPALRDAYRMQHAPENEEEVAASRRRLAFDELLLLQLGVHMKRAHLRQSLRAPSLRWTEQIDAHIRARLPFTLTAAQDRAVGEIARDLALGTPTNRLLQGDVGSGKTLVALYAALLAVASRHQAALMAPTELLAEQHFDAFTRVLAGSSVRVALLTGATPDAERAATLAALERGEADILVGTHALLTEGVRFRSLALAIIDEQHRFGVHQRARLRAQATSDTSTPHVLVMTATPIPRSLAMTLFGDLDISYLRGLPPGRQPIVTSLHTPEDREDVYDAVAERLARGEQAYVVVPAIEPGESIQGATPLRDVGTTLEELGRTYFRGRRLAAIHGRLNRSQRETVMERFRRGEIDALVATTVIEVGVDVPNATAMVIEQAERFGIAQLHQLRGRVGRGTAASACFLIAEPSGPEAMDRLRAVRDSSDGFALAEADFLVRGPGDLLSTRQSGDPLFRRADLLRDLDLLNLARADAAAWIARSPRLALPDEALLRKRLMKTYGDALGLADVG